MSRSRAGDEGSAAVEFVLVVALVAAVALGVLQIVLGAHVRSTLTACASEGARVAAVDRQGETAGADRAVSCAASSLGIDATADVAASTVGGRAAVRVTLAGPAPALLWWGGGTAQVTARALREGVDDAR